MPRGVTCGGTGPRSGPGVRRRRRGRPRADAEGTATWVRARAVRDRRRHRGVGVSVAGVEVALEVGVRGASSGRRHRSVGMLGGRRSFPGVAHTLRRCSSCSWSAAALPSRPSHRAPRPRLYSAPLPGLRAHVGIKSTYPVEGGLVHVLHDQDARRREAPTAQGGSWPMSRPLARGGNDTRCRRGGSAGGGCTRRPDPIRCGCRRR